jgi:hypothetical protein
MIYNVFTWNMQRGPSQDHSPVATLRSQVLAELCNWAHFGFITEPGKDIRDYILLHGINTGYRGWFYMSGNADNQSDSSACRPVVYSRVPLHNEDVDFLSGGADAYRYPAGASLMLNYTEGGVAKQQKLMLISFHATSGFNANENCQDLFDRCYDPRFLDEPSLWVIGGDFNCNGGNATYMPTSNTHQSGHILDGFFADHFQSSFRVIAAVNAQTYTIANGCPGQLVLAGAGAAVQGYVRNGTHLSDHCPVRARLDIAIDPMNWFHPPTAVIQGGPQSRANRGTNPKQQREWANEGPNKRSRRS